MNDDTDVMTAAETAKYLKVSTKVVYRMARAKKLPCMWVGKRARFSKAAMEKRLGVPGQEKARRSEKRNTRGRKGRPTG